MKKNEKEIINEDLENMSDEDLIQLVQQQQNEDEIPQQVTPELLEYLYKLESRRIYLFGDVNKTNILNVIYQIQMLEDRSNEDIELVINSDGGFIVDCFALIDIMDACRCDIKTTVYGLAASAACMIASNGTKGKRYAGKQAEFMFHEVMGDLHMIRKSDLPSIIKDTTRYQNKFNKLFSRNTGQPTKIISNCFYGLSQDKYMTTAEAKKFGIIDHVISPRRKQVEVEKVNKKKKAKK